MKEILKGGEGDGKPDSEFPKKELKKGSKHEHEEHGGPKALGKEIAKDHLVEDNTYYEKLERIEKQSTIIGEPMSDIQAFYYGFGKAAAAIGLNSEQAISMANFVTQIDPNQFKAWLEKNAAKPDGDADDKGGEDDGDDDKPVKDKAGVPVKRTINTADNGISDLGRTANGMIGGGLLGGAAGMGIGGLAGAGLGAYAANQPNSGLSVGQGAAGVGGLGVGLGGLLGAGAGATIGGIKGYLHNKYAAEGNSYLPDASNLGLVPGAQGAQDAPAAGNDIDMLGRGQGGDAARPEVAQANANKPGFLSAFGRSAISDMSPGTPAPAANPGLMAQLQGAYGNADGWLKDHTNNMIGAPTALAGAAGLAGLGGLGYYMSRKNKNEKKAADATAPESSWLGTAGNVAANVVDPLRLRTQQGRATVGNAALSTVDPLNMTKLRQAPEVPTVPEASMMDTLKGGYNTADAWTQKNLGIGAGTAAGIGAAGAAGLGGLAYYLNRDKKKEAQPA